MSERLLVSTRKGLFSVDRRGKGRWELGLLGFLGEPVTLSLDDPRDGRLYAALNLGHFGVKLHRSSDAGTTWEECAAPTYPESTGKSLMLIWALETGGPGERGVLWAGTAPGGLFRSTDGGDSWRLNEPLWTRPEREQWFGGGYDQPGIHSICVDPRDPGRIAVGVSCAGVWATDDGGVTWENRSRGMIAEYMPPERRDDPNVQDPHRVVQSPSHPDVFWTQHHNGIFRSSDACGRWEDCSANAKPSKFGFAVAVHPKDPKMAWFIPAIKDERRVPVDGRVVVSRTRNGGTTFDVFSKGLPQEHAYDLVYRHGLDVDETGEILAMGSTTGSLWLSEDGGESWITVSTHLPPVHAVRFVRPRV